MLHASQVAWKVMHTNQIVLHSYTARIIGFRIIGFMNHNSLPPEVGKSRNLVIKEIMSLFTVFWLGFNCEHVKPCVFVQVLGGRINPVFFLVLCPPKFQLEAWGQLYAFFYMIMPLHNLNLAFSFPNTLPFNTLPFLSSEANFSLNSTPRALYMIKINDALCTVFLMTFVFTTLKKAAYLEHMFLENLSSLHFPLQCSSCLSSSNMFTMYDWGKRKLLLIVFFVIVF